MHLKFVAKTRSRANLVYGNSHVPEMVGMEMWTNKILLSEFCISLSLHNYWSVLAYLLSFAPCFKASDFHFREWQIMQHVVLFDILGCEMLSGELALQ